MSFVVTFNKENDFVGLRRMSREEAGRVLAIAERGMKNGRIVEVPEPASIHSEPTEESK